MLSNLRTGRGERRGTGWQGYPSLDVLFLHVHWECVFLRVSLYVCVFVTDWMIGNTTCKQHCFLTLLSSRLCLSLYLSAVYFTLTTTTTASLRESERENKNSGLGLKHKSIVEGGVEGNEWISRGSLVILIKNKLLMLRRDSCATVAGF